MRTLLREGVPLNAPPPDGVTALHWAALGDDAEMADLLIRGGAVLDAKNNRDWTPLVIAEDVHTGGNSIRSETTAALLRTLGAEPSPPDISREPQAR